MRTFLLLWLLGSFIACVILACMDRRPAPVCPVPVELNRTSRQATGFKGVDMIVVVDDSGSMAEEQAILSTQFFTLINSLVFPTADWKFPAAQSVRIGVVSSDMGQRYGDDLNCEYASNSHLNEKCRKCGKNGRFRTYDNGATINIREGEIKCNLYDDQPQCPTDWECRSEGDCEGEEDHPNVGCCYDPEGDGTAQSCPKLNAIYAQTPIGSGDDETTNWDLAFQTACLAKLGIEGCGFEQQLQAAAQGLIHPKNNPDPDQTFYRDEYLLAVIIVSDEEDCSIKDKQLYKSPEMELISDEPHKMNIACGSNEEFLFSASHFKEWFTSRKKDPNSVVFAAIVGVPTEPDGDAECQGKGSDLKNCLDHKDMEAVPMIEDPSSNDASWVFREACRREGPSGELITQARPGARYVELAQEFGRFSHVSSICNEDWSPAMSEIASLIANQLQGTCYPKPLDWDHETQQAKCDVVAAYEGQDECGFELDDGVSPYIAIEERGNEKIEVLYCPLPRLAAPLDCVEAEKAIAELGPDKVGWYYCEDNSENFKQACDPDGAWSGVDEDEDGKVDCEDEDCWRCEPCEGLPGVDPSSAPDCPRSCKFKVELTDPAKRITKNQRISVQCLQQVTFADTNCQENTAAVCNDGEDNDGSGVADCNDSEEYLADRNCCPMIVDEDTKACQISSSVFDICGEKGDVSDACVAAAKAFKCNLPSEEE